MKTAGDLLKEIHQNENQLPFFTRKGWMLLVVALLAIGGIIGATMHFTIISPFLK
ncbi:hypothetical protein SAMN02745671_01671 [Anaerovibrio lipolyticus DSM 3074]|uniref:Uncharacterized protein n=1 Tax=Anaerovibrio lipolyticus DSM 3074 TaxID=1120997 RepID=A0A1M6DZG8_9FIRM|nr:hypothetical protein [Anaerovibrio lipolyticus]SHI78535.1 hypothetical protein SAMN02745671_01671 [Anaerovibrio lipolyticus DSM 3074]